MKAHGGTALGQYRHDETEDLGLGSGWKKGSGRGALDDSEGSY